MGLLADRLGSSFGGLQETWRLPLCPDDLWLGEQPATVWSAPSLLEAAAFLRASTVRDPAAPAPEIAHGLRPPPPEEHPPAGREEPVRFPWEELSRAVLEEPGRVAAAVLQSLVDRHEGDPEEMLARLGVESAVAVGEDVVVLRGGAWYRVIVRSLGAELVPASSGPGNFAAGGGTAGSPF